MESLTYIAQRAPRGHLGSPRETIELGHERMVCDALGDCGE